MKKRKKRSMFLKYSQILRIVDILLPIIFVGDKASSGSVQGIKMPSKRLGFFKILSLGLH